MTPRSSPRGEPDSLSDVYEFQMKKSKVLARSVSALKEADMKFHYENICVFKDYGFLTVICFAHHVITLSLKKNL